MNLLKETIEQLSSNNKTVSDVIWVGSIDGEFSISFSEFEKIADLEYHNGYGGQEISSNLVVVGMDWWMERYEYDGSECWDFKSLPTMELRPKIFLRVTGGSWDTIQQMNE